MQYLQNAIRRHHSHNTKHTRTRAHIMNTWTKVTCAPGVQVKREWDEYNIHELKGAMEELSGNKWKQHAPTSTRPYGSAFCTRNGLQKRMTCPDCHDAQKQNSQVVHFFFAPVSRLFAPVSRVFAPVSRKTLGSFLIISGDIRCNMSISRMSKPIECKALFCVSREFIVQLCHAAMPQADEFSPWVFSTDSPMHQIASST